MNVTSTIVSNRKITEGLGSMGAQGDHCSIPYVNNQRHLHPTKHTVSQSHDGYDGATKNVQTYSIGAGPRPTEEPPCASQGA